MNNKDAEMNLRTFWHSPIKNRTCTKKKWTEIGDDGQWGDSLTSKPHKVLHLGFLNINGFPMIKHQKKNG